MLHPCRIESTEQTGLELLHRRQIGRCRRNSRAHARLRSTAVAC